MWCSTKVGWLHISNLVKVGWLHISNLVNTKVAEFFKYQSYVGRNHLLSVESTKI